jgi:hypothetical protein
MLTTSLSCAWTGTAIASAKIASKKRFMCQSPVRHVSAAAIPSRAMPPR